MKHVTAIRTIIICALALLTSACSMFVDRDNIEEPQISLKKTELSAISLSEATFDLTLEIYNPNIFDISLARFDYQLRFNDYQILTDQQRKKVNVDGRDTTLVTVPVSVKFDDIRKLVSSAVNSSEVEYNFRTTAFVNIPVIGMRQVNSHYTANFPMPKAPTIGVTDVAIGDINNSRAKGSLTLAIYNPNDFEISMKELDYEFFVNNKAWMENHLKNQTLGGKQHLSIEVPVTLPFSQFEPIVAEAIKARKATLEYKVKGDMVLDAPLPNFKAIRADIDNWGLIHP